MSATQHLIATFHRLFSEIEDMAIENEVCMDFILGRLPGLPLVTEEAIEQAMADPERRARARARFSGMWSAIEDYGLTAHMEESGDRPN